MRQAAGPRDTLITFQQRTKTGTDANFGTAVYSWADLPTDPTEWASVQDMLPSRGDRIADGIDIRKRPARIRILYRDDIYEADTSSLRVVIGARVLKIVAGPVELGRRDGLEMVCEELSTEGEAP